VSFRFSSRTHWETSEDIYAQALHAARAAGRKLIDLTASNPTACGFQFDSVSILTPLGNPSALTYDPDPRGMRSACKAVAAYYADHGASVNVDELVLTTSTSEAYSFLFRLLCDPGDEVLAAQPSYPLFDFLADVDDVRLKPYPLFYDHGWSIDLHALEQAITPRTRAVLVVHPNNPTGQYVSANERQALQELCARRGLALIVDEVFLDYRIAETQQARDNAVSFAAGDHAALTFVLSGMSKIAALPQMKAAWVLTKGPLQAQQEALRRLEIIADTFLSMSAPIQLALPHWLASRQSIQQQIKERVRANWQFVRKTLTGSNLHWLDWEAGWNLVLRAPGRSDDVAWATRLVEQHGLVTHPGSFYGMSQGRLVISLIVHQESFREGMQLLVEDGAIEA
jgi:aspartate/methionine/tyrosine aminotransferase